MEALNLLGVFIQAGNSFSCEMLFLYSIRAGLSVLASSCDVKCILCVWFCVCYCVYCIYCYLCSVIVLVFLVEFCMVYIMRDSICLE